MSRRTRTACLVAIYALTLALSLRKLDLPILEFYPVRQVQTAEVTRNLYRADHNVLVPKRHVGADLKAFVLEFPLYNAVVATGYALAGGVDERIGRLVSLAAWLLGGVCLFAFVRPYYGDRVALAALFFFHMSRIGIQTSRSFQPEATMVCLSLATLLFWDRWARAGRWMDVAAATVCGTFALLVKMPVAHIFLPVAFMVWFAGPRERRIAIVALAASLLVAVAWGAHGRTLTMSESPHMSGNWDLDNWFSPALLASAGFYRKLVTIWRGEVFGSAIFALMIVGLLLRPESRRHGVFHAWFAAGVVYLCFFNRHAITHNYYNVPIIAVGAVFAARAFDLIPELTRRMFVPGRAIQAAVVLFIAVTTTAYVRGRAYAIPANMLGTFEAAAALEHVTPPEALVTSPGHLAAYFADRRGWELSPESAGSYERLRALRAEGAQAFATGDLHALAGNTELAAFLDTLPVLARGDRFVVYDLSGPQARGSR